MTAADPRDGLLAFADRVERLAFSMPAPNPYTPQFVELAIAARSLAHARPEAVDERVVREVAVAINYAWIGVDGSARQWWAQLGSNERKHKDDVARAAIAAYHEALTPDQSP